MSGERLLFKNGLHLRAQTIESTTHVGHSGGKPYLRSAAKIDHLRKLSRIDLSSDGSRSSSNDGILKGDFTMLSKLVLTAFLIASGCPAFSQAAPAATQGGSKLVVGVGFSDFSTDWSGRMVGATFWADWNFNRNRGFLGGLGVEVEGRDLNYGRTGGVPNLRQETVGGGPIYTMRHYRRFQPYGKVLVGFGRIDFGHLTPTYSHDSREVIAPGGGVDYRAWRDVWVRGDYESRSMNFGTMSIASEIPIFCKTISGIL